MMTLILRQVFVLALLTLSHHADEEEHLIYAAFFKAALCLYRKLL